MEGRYPPAVWLSLADCTDAAKEPDYNRWYNEVRIPQMESTGFIRNVCRFENVFADTPTYLGRPRYLTVAEVYRDDSEAALKEIRQLSGKAFDAELCMVDTLYRKVGTEQRTDRTGRRVRGLHLALCYVIDPARDADFNRWYDDKHGPDTLGLGLFDTAYRYKVVSPHDTLPYRPDYLALYDTSIDPLTARQKLAGARAKWLSDPMWVELLGLYYAGTFRQVYPGVK